MGTTMRAKLQVGFVQENTTWGTEPKEKTSETLTMHGVCAKSYPADGSDEDNTFAKFSPQADFRLTIANPALWDKFKVGYKFYVDFTPAE